MWTCTCAQDAGVRDGTMKRLRRLLKYRIELRSTSPYAVAAETSASATLKGDDRIRTDASIVNGLRWQLKPRRKSAD